MIRQEAKEQLLRWREVLVGGAAVLLGLMWLVGQSKMLLLPGMALLVAGAALIWLGIQRARFRAAGRGPGVVQVDEGQIIYFGPLSGGAVALQQLVQVVYDPGQLPAHWRLEQRSGLELLIPANAEGAEILYDAFATLPGLRMEQVLAAINMTDRVPKVVWRRDVPNPAHLSLH